MNLSSRSPLRWVPSLYFAMGLPFVVLNMVSAVLYKDLGISDARSVLLSLRSLPSAGRRTTSRPTESTCRSYRLRPRRNTSAGRGRSTTLRNWSPRAVWCGLRGGFTRVSAPRGPHRSTLMSVRGRSFCCSCASRSSLWAFTISARFLQAVRLQKAARCGMAFRA